MYMNILRELNNMLWRVHLYEHIERIKEVWDINVLKKRYVKHKSPKRTLMQEP